MATFRCKVCGGSVQIDEANSTVVCEYCGNRQVMPRFNDSEKAALLERAEDCRRSGDFDRAMALYEKALLTDNTDPEIFWSIVLCRYGITYVCDPRTGQTLPTVNRTRTLPVQMDADYQKALRLADAEQRVFYEEQAQRIDTIQQQIIRISQNEPPFDIFICYKETDAQGRRTHESAYAAQMYHLLTKDGYKVFFARVTLEDKLGSAYEPIIFSALQSSKVMVAVGTSKANFEAPWVRNEWSRYLQMIQNGEDKTLIPAYRDMDPYDLPQEFAYLQALDINNLGFMQDLLHALHKLIPRETPVSQEPARSGAQTAQQSVTQENPQPSEQTQQPRETQPPEQTQQPQETQPPVIRLSVFSVVFLILSIGFIIYGINLRAEGTLSTKAMGSIFTGVGITALGLAILLFVLKIIRSRRSRPNNRVKPSRRIKDNNFVKINRRIKPNDRR